MKLYLYLALAVTAVGGTGLTDEEFDEMQKVIQPCRKKWEPTEDMVQRARRAEMVDTPKMHQMALCVLTTYRIITRTGEINVNVVKRMARRVCDSDEEAKSVTDSCCIQKDKPKDTAFDMAKCVLGLKPRFALPYILSTEQKALLNATSRVCRTACGTTDEMIEKARRGQLEENPVMRKHVLCMMKMMGMMDEQGDMVMEVIKPKVRREVGSEEETEEMMVKCCVKKTKPEDTAFDMMKCLMEMPNFHIVP